MTPRQPIIPRREHESDSERRLREALNRICNEALHALDCAMNLRTAPQSAQHARHKARNAMAEFANKAMTALAFAEEVKLPPENPPKGD